MDISFVLKNKNYKIIDKRKWINDEDIKKDVICFIEALEYCYRFKYSYNKASWEFDMRIIVNENNNVILQTI